MKKNKALTAAISVLSLTMVSMCAIGGTFAKYVTNGGDNDTATVAKWGVVITAEADSASVIDTVNSNPETHVLTTTYIVAPGTKDTLVDIKITGTPEVSVDIDQTATFDLTGNWLIPSGEHDDPETPEDESVEFYCPIEFYVNDVLVTGTSETDLENNIVAALKLDPDTIQPNTTLDSDYDTIFTWEWKFHVDDETSAKDTLLGDNSATSTLGFNVSVSTTVTQVD